MNENKLIDWEGERMNPTNANLDSAANHIIRYQFAKSHLNGMVLDAASGAGYGTYLLAKGYDGEVQGIDIEKTAVDFANNFYNDLHNLSFQVRDIYKTEFIDNTFDAVTSFETLEHLPELDGYFEELHRITKDGGTLIFSVPDYLTNNGAGNLNKFHLNELPFNDFKSYLEKYFSSQQYYFQKIAKPSNKTKLVSYIASFLPLKLKAALKRLVVITDTKTRFNGRNFSELKSAYSSLFNEYRVREISEYFEYKNEPNDKRYVFIAVCKK